MNVNGHAERMKQYIDSLPSTSVHVVYFESEKSHIPFTKEVIRRLEIGGETFYINSGPLGKWVYTYRLDDIKYLFTRVHAPFHGGAIFDMASIGNHLTVGIYTFNHHKWITSHYTRYIEDASNPMEFLVDHSMNCSLDLDAPIEPTSVCFTKREVSTNETLSHICSREPFWVNVIQTLHRAFNFGPQHGGNGKTHLYFKGSKYKIQLGSRGGKYILHNNKRIYWKDNTKLQGGASGTRIGTRIVTPVLTNDVIQMIYEHVVRPVVQHYKQFHQHLQTTLLYDQDNEFHSNTSYIILVYAIPDHFMCRRFYLETTKVFAAFEANFQGISTPYNVSCLQEFRAMGVLHTELLANLVG